MNLLIDIGNTSVKYAVAQGERLVEVCHVPDIDSEILDRLDMNYDIKKCILCTTRQMDGSLSALLRQRYSRTIFLSDQTPLPIKIGYRTPCTLGRDRIAAAVAASESSGRLGAVIIDAGTAVTYDFLDGEGVYQGGSIAPGLALRFKSLHDYTQLLPLVEADGEVPLVGYDTLTAIRSGVVNGICNEIEGFIGKIKAKHPFVLVFLTGGDADYLAEQLNFSIFVDRNLVLKGLNRILNYNAEI